MSQQDLNKAFDQVAALLADIQQEWWIIGSSALALHGISGLDVADIDILVPDIEAGALVANRLGAEVVSKDPHPQFHSDLFATLTFAGLDIEVMSGFCVISNGEMLPVLPKSRLAFERKFGFLYAPSLEELEDILRLFGRKKDGERLALIEAWRTGRLSD